MTTLFALADAAEARVIITGDRDVQAVDVPGIDVMSPRAAADPLAFPALLDTCVLFPQYLSDTLLTQAYEGIFRA